MPGQRVIFMGKTKEVDRVKRQKVNRRVEFARTENKRPREKKSFTQLYGVSSVHGVRGIALNADWSVGAEGQS